METILQKPNCGDYKLWRPNYGDLIERPHIIYDICIETLSGDPIQRYIYKSFFKTKLIAKKNEFDCKNKELDRKTL